MENTEPRARAHLSRLRVRRRLGWAAFFLFPILFLAGKMWPETPDLPLGHWGSDLALEVRYDFSPDTFVTSSLVVPGPRMFEGGFQRRVLRSSGQRRLVLQIDLLAVTEKEVVFELRAHEFEDSEKFLNIVRADSAEFRVPLGGAHRAEPFPGLSVTGAFVPDPGSGWKDLWSRWDQNFDFSFFHWLAP